MKVPGFLIPLLLLFITAHAQAQAFDFNGLPLGATAKQYFAVYPFHTCKPGVCAFDLAQCAARKIDHCQELSTWSGVPLTALRAVFEGGKLVRVVLNYRAERFDQIAAQLRRKYGPPKSVRTVPERMVTGEAVTNRVLEWSRAGTGLSIRKYGIRATEGYAVIQFQPALGSPGWIGKP